MVQGWELSFLKVEGASGDQEEGGTLGITGQIRFLRGTFQSLDFVILPLFPARTFSEAPWHMDYIH